MVKEFDIALQQQLADQKAALNRAAAAAKQAALEELTKRLQAEFADERSRLQKKFDAQLGKHAGLGGRLNRGLCRALAAATAVSSECPPAAR